MRALFHLLAWLPLGALQALGAFAGWLSWISNSARRRIALRNLERCMPQLGGAERERMARAALAHEFMTYIETIRVWLGPSQQIRNAVKEWRGLDVLDRAFAQNKGVILLTLHQGAFEAIAIPMSERYPFCGLYKPQRGIFNELSIKGRTRFGGQLRETQAGVRKQSLELLAQGMGVYFMPDHDPPEGRGVFVPFMGRTAHTPTLVAKLAHESGSPVVYMFGERLPHARGFIAHFIDAPEDISSGDVIEASTAMNRGLEQCLRTCPEQYWWGYKRFRRQPPGVEKFYAGI
jgi:KDO2-lipid IV(A) lauroyltransferase